jgi:hypothetical protein
MRSPLVSVVRFGRVFDRMSMSMCRWWTHWFPILFQCSFQVSGRAFAL